MVKENALRFQPNFIQRIVRGRILTPSPDKLFTRALFLTFSYSYS